jgi:hypothetical protein
MKAREDEAEYAARTIRNFLDGTCGDYDWDDFNYSSFGDAKVDAVRQRAFAVELPVDEKGRAVLEALADEAERLATGNGS